MYFPPPFFFLRSIQIHQQNLYRRLLVMSGASPGHCYKKWAQTGKANLLQPRAMMLRRKNPSFNFVSYVGKNLIQQQIRFMTNNPPKPVLACGASHGCFAGDTESKDHGISGYFPCRLSVPVRRLRSQPGTTTIHFFTFLGTQERH